MFKKIPKAPKAPKPPKIKVQKTRKIGNRTLIGILSIVVALLICFGVAPVINRVADSKTEIVRVKTMIPKGTCINESDLETVTVGAYNLPENVIRKKADAVGKYATGDLYAGDWILPGNLTPAPDSATDILDSLGNDRKAMSVTIGSFAQGLSGKLETGDIISVIVQQGRLRLHAARVAISAGDYEYHLAGRGQVGCDRRHTARDGDAARQSGAGGTACLL